MVVFPEKKKKKKTPLNFIFYPQVCYHLSRYSPGILKYKAELYYTKSMKKWPVLSTANVTNKCLNESLNTLFYSVALKKMKVLQIGF